MIHNPIQSSSEGKRDYTYRFVTEGRNGLLPIYFVKTQRPDPQNKVPTQKETTVVTTKHER